VPARYPARAALVLPLCQVDCVELRSGNSRHGEPSEAVTTVGDPRPVSQLGASRSSCRILFACRKQRSSESPSTRRHSPSVRTPFSAGHPRNRQAASTPASASDPLFRKRQSGMVSGARRSELRRPGLQKADLTFPSRRGARPAHSRLAGHRCRNARSIKAQNEYAAAEFGALRTRGT